MYIADVTNHPVLFARNPEWRMWADMIPDQALTTRRKLLDMVAADRLPITGYHYPFPRPATSPSTATATTSCRPIGSPRSELKPRSDGIGPGL